MSAVLRPPDSEKGAPRNVSPNRGAEGVNQETRALILPSSPRAFRAAGQAEKEIATLRAALAVKGYTSQQLADESWILGQWGYSTKALPDLESVRDFALRVGALK